MAMPIKDFRQLEKLMMQTTSDHDAEALAALRLANKILAKHGYDWSAAFARLVKVEDPSVPDVEDGGDTIPRDHAPPVGAQDAARVARINDAFAELDGRWQSLSGRTQDFIRSLREQWAEGSGFLSAKQEAALLRNLE